MPYLKIQSNKRIENEDEVIKEASRLVAEELGKPESYVMVALEPTVKISMAGTQEPAVFMEVKSIGLPESVTGKLSRALCDFVEEKLGIDQNRVYIVFSDIDRSMWGWNGNTF